jgi:hypothetical protein
MNGSRLIFVYFTCSICIKWKGIGIDAPLLSGYFVFRPVFWSSSIAVSHLTLLDEGMISKITFNILPTDD